MLGASDKKWTLIIIVICLQAEKLIDMRIHPQTIVAGWRKATKVARGVLEANVSEFSL